jgi:hypothetical protein
VLLVFYLLFGVGVLLGNIAGMNAPPVTTPTCSGVPMSITDTCQQQNYLNGNPTTTQYFTYDQMLAQEQPDTGVAAWFIGIGVLMIASGGFWLYRWFGKRTLIPTRFTRSSIARNRGG